MTGRRDHSNAGGFGDLVHRGGGKSLRPEQAARRRQDRLRCRSPPLRLFRHVSAVVEMDEGSQLTFRLSVGIYRLSVGFIHEVCHAEP